MHNYVDVQEQAKTPHTGGFLLDDFGQVARKDS